MEYVALKPCSLGGRKFRIGETVPEEVIQPGAEKNLIGMQIIAAKEGADSTAAPEAITIKIDGDLELKIKGEGLQSVVDVLVGTADDAEATIKEMTDADALILLDYIDKRKTVKELAKERALALGE